MNIAERMFDGERAKSDLEDDLFEAGAQFDDIGFDYYDNSLELLDVPNDYRMTFEVQRIIFEAGFSKVYLNHKNKWETHYTFGPEPFKVVDGWRVSYPEKRGKDEKGILVEKQIESWPQEWFETGYAVVKDPND